MLLRARRAAVAAVDVGYGELAWSLRQDERVRVLERTNVRDLGPGSAGDPVDLIVADLSFISLTKVLPALIGRWRAGGDLVLMVKPQFEVGRERLGKGGVVRDPDLRKAAVADVADAALDLGWGTAGVCASPLPGPAGNVEYFLWLRRDARAGRRRHGLGRRRRGSSVRGLSIATTPSAARTVLLIAHTGRPEAVDVARAVAKRLMDSDLTVRLLARPAGALGSRTPRSRRATSDAARAARSPLSSAATAPSCAAPRSPGWPALPLLGINLGHVGFLAEAEWDDLESTVDAIIHRRYVVEERLTVDVVVTLDGEQLSTGWALNEVSVEKATRQRMLEVVVEVDGRPLSRWGCDGVVFATPTGRLPTPSAPAARWCGPMSRRCCWCRSPRTRCSRGRWWSRPTPPWPSSWSPPPTTGE